MTATTRTLVYVSVAKALRNGELVRQSCEVCGTAKTDAHHEDYDRPLDVRWLCRMHHVWRHLHGDTIELMKARHAPPDDLLGQVKARTAREQVRA